jgi:hypothetical protein
MEAVGLLIQEGARAGGADGVHGKVLDLVVAAVVLAGFDQEQLGVFPPHLDDGLHLRVKIAGGFGLGDDLVDEFRPEEFGDQLAGRAGDGDAPNPLRGNPGENFGQYLEDRLQGLPLRAGVMFFDDLLALIDQNRLGAYRSNVQS